MKFLTDYPAMIIKDYLVVSDLHIGITKGLYDKGISIPSQVKGMITRIHKLKKIGNAKNLVILGDLKHRVPGISWQEKKEIPEFLSNLKFNKIILIKGNHDGNIEDLIPTNKKIQVKKNLIIGDCYLTHGHMNIDKDKATQIQFVIIGHNQPRIAFQDDMKAKYFETVWIQGYLKNERRVIIIPAFNELCGSTLFNKNKPIGPIAKNLNYKKSHAYLLDGTDLGKLNDLKKV
ncbi:MAG: metallophosphoesterase [Candidatus Aenigmatarchaeota archaeon]